METPVDKTQTEATAGADILVTRCSCGGEKRVIHSKDYGDYIRRERECDKCGRRFEDRDRQVRELPRRGNRKTNDCAYQAADGRGNELR